MSIHLVPLAKAARPVTPMTRSALQWVAYWREFNGVEKFGAIVKVGGRLYCNPERFTAWMATGPTISPPGLKKPKAIPARAA
jgi:hypothetical protein